MPAKWRDLISVGEIDRVMITNFRSGPTPCLDVYPYAAWLSMEERMSKRPQFHPKVQAFTEYYISNAQECQMDKQGRILLPPLLRTRARLVDAVIFTGAGPKFQIWDEKAWDEVHSRAETAIFTDPAAFFSDLEI